VNPLDLLKTASDLSHARGKPRQSNLKRSIITCYYALFHTLARSCADLVIGGLAQIEAALHGRKFIALLIIVLQKLRVVIRKSSSFRNPYRILRTLSPLCRKSGTLPITTRMKECINLLYY
jgi:hypothetical protein